jgi:hypothetical protein
VAQVIEHLLSKPSKHEALNSSPGPAKKKKKYYYTPLTVTESPKDGVCPNCFILHNKLLQHLVT